MDKIIHSKPLVSKLCAAKRDCSEAKSELYSRERIVCVRN